MENKDSVVLIFGLMIGAFLGVSVSLVQLNDKPNVVTPTTICKEDSLQNLVNELKMDLKMQSDGFDSKEKRYSEILFEYEYGIDHLKIYQPHSYREFHRILSHKEIFNRQDEQDNIKRLEAPKW